MSTEIRVQHYVPRFYLTNFCSRNKEKKYLYCFDKLELKKLRVGIAHIGCESGFFSVRDSIAQSLEARFGKLESVFSMCYRKLVKTRTMSCLSDDDKMVISYYVAAQELRTKEFREMLRDMVYQFRTVLSDERMSEELEMKLNKAVTQESIQSLQIAMFADIPRFADIFRAMKWTLFRNHTDMSLWTSDHPISRYNKPSLRPRGNTGLLSKGIQVYFPLTPRLSLGFGDPKLYARVPSEYNMIDPDFIVFQNWLQTARSTRHIFSSNSDFSLAERILRENPSLGVADRKRVQVL